MTTKHTEYAYSRETIDSSWNQWMLAHIDPILARHQVTTLFEIGCGNGSVANRMQQNGFSVTAIDPSESGIGLARKASSGASFHVDTVERLSSNHDYGLHDCVLSLEVIEHCYSPKAFMSAVDHVLRPGGVLILSTPYHGYLKNLVLAISGKLDNHFTALWEGGHIKFFSVRTLSELVQQQGFEVTDCLRVGRIPALAKSMILIARKPETDGDDTDTAESVSERGS